MNQSAASNSSLDQLSDMAIINVLNQKKATLLIPAIVYTAIMMVIGLIGNPLAIYIYGWRWQKTTTRNFLLGIALMDLVNCLITMPTEIAVMMNFYFFDNGHVCKMSRFSTYVMNNATSFILVVVSVDRYIRICRPYSQPITPWGALISTGIAIIIGAGVSWPALVLYGREEIPLPLPGGRIVRGVMCLVENEYVNTNYPFAFFIYFWVGVSVTSTIIITMYILIGKEILKRNRMKRERNQSAAKVMMKYRNMSNSTEQDVFLPQTPQLGIRKSESTPTKPLTSSSDSLPIPDSATPSVTSPTSTKRFTFPRDKAVSIASAVWNKSKVRGGRSTLMLFAITVLYVLSFLPFLIVVTIRTHVGDSFYQKLSRTEQVIVNIFIRSYLINNCANPIVYGLCNSQFRLECRKLFSRICGRSKESVSNSSSNVNRPGGGSSVQEKSGN